MISKIRPKNLTDESLIGFFTPSDPILPKRVEFIKKGLQILSEWGLKTKFVDEKKIEYWGKRNDPKDKIKEFNDLLHDSAVDVLMATWGGKNSSDLLDLIDYDLVGYSNKIIIGHSDVAVILNAITEKTNLVTFYGPNVLGKLNQTKEIGFPLQRMKSYSGYKLFSFKEIGGYFIVNPGICKGELYGGSLGTFTLGLSGTAYIPTSNEIIFFFESSSLDLYRIRQHLQHLKLTGFIRRVVGVITGTNTQISDEESKEFNELLISYFPDCPIIRSEYFGHGFYLNPSIPIGGYAQLDLKHKINCTLI